MVLTAPEIERCPVRGRFGLLLNLVFYFPVRTSEAGREVEKVVCFVGGSIEITELGARFVLPDERFGGGVVDAEECRGLFEFGCYVANGEALAEHLPQKFEFGLPGNLHVLRPHTHMATLPVQHPFNNYNQINAQIQQLNHQTQQREHPFLS